MRAITGRKIEFHASSRRSSRAWTISLAHKRPRVVAKRRRAEDDRPARPRRRGRPSDRRERQRLCRGGGGAQKNRRTTPCPCLCTWRRDAARDRSGAGYSAERRRCEGLVSAGFTGWGSSRESQRLEARRWRSRDARLEKRNSGPRPVGPRDDGRDRIAREHSASKRCCLSGKSITFGALVPKLDAH